MIFSDKFHKNFKNPVLVIVLLIILFFTPFIFKPELLTERDNDLGRTYVPLFSFLKISVTSHNQIPLWRPDQMMGETFIGNPLSSLFYPANIIFLLLEIKIALIAYLLLHFLLAGVFTFFAAKSYKLSAHASIAAALFYAFSNKLLLHLSAGHITMIAAFSYFPLLFLSLRLGILKKNFKWIIIGSIALSATYINYPTIFYYSIIFSVVYFCFRIFTRSEKLYSSIKLIIFKYLSRFLLMFVIMLGLSTIVIVPQLEFAPLSTRPQLNLEDVAIPLWNLKRFLTSLLFPYLSFESLNHESFLYLGIVPTVLAALGFLKFSNRKKMAIIIIGILTLMFVAGLSTPLFKMAYELLPFLKYSRVTTRLWFITAFVIALTSAIAIDRLKSKVLVYLLLGLFLLEAFYIGYKKIFVVPYLDFKKESIYQFLESDNDIFRIYCTSYCFNPQLLSKYNLQILNGENPIQQQGLVRFIERAGNYSYSNFAVIFPPYPVWQNENPPIPDANLLGLANVKYIGSTYDLVNIDFELIQNFDDIKIYKNNKYKKRAFFEHSSENVTVTSYKPNEIELRFKKSSDFRNLILSENYYPGWSAYVDGQKLDVGKYMDVFRKVTVPPNSDSVVFKHQPANYAMGKTLTFGTIILLLIYSFQKFRKKGD
ncbi:hypothetical protein A3I53_02590 [Candidatus Curtissbacteria bacterium RIFCSPLOWO2_02_FULL_40_13b]|uniref:Membrane protein 6-pyruvoyl-tetrahydropterin synthase-related domain-containing protein n=1 Tax=Candidatus Curtissbacteria bacterium RIFCSPLOWO2_02_FULL_40_13b TaxID=1797733 RepID=A0A1F5HX03_9BACT|nr:MAG: hypothetical protein A3I53_02590 [Candidatus Curtissbacteria bacterium RIFCSPLOWO2_02_FULL_40_13b]